MSEVMMKQRRKEQRRGVTAVEFAIVAPLILTLFLGAIELTRLNFLRHTAANAAYEAARTCVVPGATVAEGIAEANRLLQAMGAGNQADIQVVPSPDSILVTVTIPVSQNSWALGRFSKNFNLVQSCQLRRESIQ